MNLAQRFGPELPYLRRYARALTGSQESGDAQVRVALEAMARKERAVDSGLPARLALYKVFHGAWSAAAPVEALADQDDAEEAVDVQSRLLRITPTSRQALLLTAMEGFSPEEAATIIGTTRTDVEAMIVEAQREIEAQLATDVLIIEDEPVIAMDIEELVRSLGHDVVSVARTREEAVAAARALAPGLVLADIQLADGSSGISAVADILRETNAPTIFITAYPERLLTGERPEPVFIITKPFEPETVKTAIAQALFFHSGQRSAHPE
jgi:CheY-like chemotaxis protein